MEASRRELSEYVSFGIGTLLVGRAIELGKPPQRGVIYITNHIRYSQYEKYQLAIYCQYLGVPAVLNTEILTGSIHNFK